MLKFQAQVPFKPVQLES